MLTYNGQLGPIIIKPHQIDSWIKDERKTYAHVYKLSPACCVMHGGLLANILDSKAFFFYHRFMDRPDPV